ncbi:MAG: NADH:flavin oxidoreductase [Anaerolineales bacterium]|nr:NADH:flavin oxidoreductase [Anaerolineales bacterium]
MASGKHPRQLFSPGWIGSEQLENRLIRAATWDPSLFAERRMMDPVREVYRRVAAGGIGAIITGDLSVVPAGLLESCDPQLVQDSYAAVRIEGFDDLVHIVRSENPRCRIFAQVSADVMGYAPSVITSPYTMARSTELSADQIEAIVVCLVQAVKGLKCDGFDGVELHAAHGGLLSQFISPYTNRRTDRYGGSLENRVRILSEILSGARSLVGGFPILIKLNATDYIPGGLSFTQFPDLARSVQAAGADAIEISGGMWDCLIRSEEELGFPPVPSPESHTGIDLHEKQSYFLPAAEGFSLDIPVILTGGNRDAAELEAILERGVVDFIGLCRPLIREPDLPRRWQKGETTGTRCIACNACIYEMWTQVMAGKPWVTRCLLDEAPERWKEAQHWLNRWVEENALAGIDAAAFFA